MTQLALEGLGVIRLGNGQTLGPYPPAHLLWHSDDRTAICGQRDPLPVCLAWFRMAHVAGHRRANKPAPVWCPTCIQIAAHDHTAQPGPLYWASGNNWTAP